MMRMPYLYLENYQIPMSIKLNVSRIKCGKISLPEEYSIIDHRRFLCCSINVASSSSTNKLNAWLASYPKEMSQLLVLPCILYRQVLTTLRQINETFIDRCRFDALPQNLFRQMLEWLCFLSWFTYRGLRERTNTGADLVNIWKSRFISR